MTAQAAPAGGGRGRGVRGSWRLGSLRSMGGWRRGWRACHCRSTLLIWLGGLHHTPQRGLGPLRGRHGRLGLEPLCPGLGVGKDRVRLPALGAFMEDGDGNVARPELGVHSAPFPGGQRPGALPRRPVCRGRGFLGALGGHARVIPRRGAAVVVHEEGPAGLRVDLDLPARGQRVAVAGAVARRHLHHGRVGDSAHVGSGSARWGGRRGAESRGAGVAGCRVTGSRGAGPPGAESLAGYSRS